MKVKFGTGNRITIPKDIVNNYKLKEGEFLELNIEDGKLVLTKINNTKDVNKVENYSIAIYSGMYLITFFIYSHL